MGETDVLEWDGATLNVCSFPFFPTEEDPYASCQPTARPTAFRPHARGMYRRPRGSGARDRFFNLTSAQQSAVLAYINSL